MNNWRNNDGGGGGSGSRNSGGGGGFGGGPGPIPNRWLRCPRKADGFIADKFLVFKTPLGAKFNEDVPVEYRFPPKMIVDYMNSKKVKMGLWIDLTNTSRFYSKDEVESRGIKYVKLNCRGHGECPSSETVEEFIQTCNDFIKDNGSDYIGVHCTHGFNRSGFLIISFLVREYDFALSAAFTLFSRFRPPGIYKQDYINTLWDLYKDDDDPPPPKAPELPDWCLEEEDADDDTPYGTGSSSSSNSNNNPNKRSAQNGGFSGGGGNKRRRTEFVKKDPKFMEGVVGVEPVEDPEERTRIQRAVQHMCRWNGNGFPGSQPVSMDRNNLGKLAEKPYMVSWKADGTRYLMWIEGEGRIFFIDRDNCVFHCDSIRFPYKKNLHEHLSGTLVDGEMVMDNVDGCLIPRYLVYDVIKFRDEDTGLCDFRIRLMCIRDEIVSPRYRAIETGIINREMEPFGIRFKQFWFAEDAEKILDGKFKDELLHEPDGLIFQPTKEPYVSGRCDEVLKWKPPELNSVDFRLKVVTQTGMGILPCKVGELYVGGMNAPYSFMKPIPKNVQQYDGKIIECSYNGKTWVFLRERTDKSFPNAFATAQAVVFSITYPITKDYLLEFIGTRRWRKHGVI